MKFGHSSSARRAMFIDARRNQVPPPSGGPCISVETSPVHSNIALLAEGDARLSPDL